MKRRENKAAVRGRVLWLYVKYQLMTKGVLFLAVFPLYSLLLDTLLRSAGRVNISSGDYWRFLFSFQGAGMLLLMLMLLSLLVGTDINAFIILSALIREGRISMTARHLFFVAVRSVRLFLKPSGIFVMLYVAVAIPLVGIGVTISPMEEFQIPNFITSVIFDTPTYRAIYILLLFFLGFLTFKYIFAFHYILLRNNGVKEALKNAAGLMKRHWKSFLKDFILLFLLLMEVIFLVYMFIFAMLLLPASIFPNTELESRIWTIVAILSFVELTALLTLMTVPTVTYRLTELFYRYHEREGDPVQLSIQVRAEMLGEEKYGRVRFRTKVAFVLFVGLMIFGNLVFATYLGADFDDVFRSSKEIALVAHRGGGDLAAENSLEGLRAAIREGAAWSEIDLQRTKDGHYIVHHDNNFLRLSGDSRTPAELTLEEVKRLRVRDHFDASRPSQKIGTVEEFLDEAKGKIGLLLELKGKSADPKMVDDVVRMLKERDMIDEVAILSLDYGLIEYAETTYPEVRTGYLYFFSIGATEKMTGDILMMEEREATAEKVQAIRAAGKEVIVWTVNTPESIDKFLNAEIDGICTDRIREVREGMKRRDDRSDLDVIMDFFLK